MGMRGRLLVQTVILGCEGALVLVFANSNSLTGVIIIMVFFLCSPKLLRRFHLWYCPIWFRGCLVFFSWMFGFSSRPFYHWHLLSHSPLVEHCHAESTSVYQSSAQMIGLRSGSVPWLGDCVNIVDHTATFSRDNHLSSLPHTLLYRTSQKETCLPTLTL